VGEQFWGRAVRKRPVTRMSPGRFLLHRPGVTLPLIVLAGLFSGGVKGVFLPPVGRLFFFGIALR